MKKRDNKKNKKKNSKNKYVKKSLKDVFVSTYLASSTLFGTKKKADILNNESINRVKNKKEELTILIHGYMANYYKGMYSTIKWFKKRKINIVSIGYDFRNPTPETMLKVKLQIEGIMKKARVKKINIIGISLGGSIARYYAEKLGGKKVIDKLVTIYTPLKKIPEKDWGHKVHAFLGNNPDLANSLIKSTEGKYSVKNHLAIYGIKDGWIRAECTRSKKIKQIGVMGGHTFVSYNPAVMRIVLSYLREEDIFK